METKNDTFTLLSYSELQLKTRLLLNQYKSNNGCYIAPEYSLLRERVLGSENNSDKKYLGLRKMYEKKVPEKEKEVGFFTSFVVSNKPSNTRLDQIDLIVQICKSLPEKTSKTEVSKVAYYHNVLIAILTLRYQRLLVEYGNKVNEARKRCALFACLEEILDLSPENENFNQLDSYTIASNGCDLEFFLKKNKNSYAALKKDEKFFDKLKEMINEANHKNAKTRVRLDVCYIRFIESLEHLLSGLSDPINQILNDLEHSCRSFKTYRLEDIYPQLEILLKQQIDQIRKKCEELARQFEYRKITSSVYDAELKKQKSFELCTLICSDAFHYLEDLIKDKTFDNFKSIRTLLCRAMEVKYQYLLFGAYFFVLDQVPKEGKLAESIHYLLNINIENRPDWHTEKCFLTVLQNFVQIKGYDQKPCIEKLFSFDFVKSFSLFEEKLRLSMTNLLKRRSESNEEDLVHEQSLN